MPKYQPGDDVEVKFDGIWSPGEVLQHKRGWVTAVINIDPAADYGAITPRLAPQQPVCVREDMVRHAS